MSVFTPRCDDCTPILTKYWTILRATASKGSFLFESEQDEWIWDQKLKTYASALNQNLPLETTLNSKTDSHTLEATA
ncbi:hypothetical protein AGOR_G00122370 [Albula goreensis]|uniref:Uncharacterized protein n=1 Tax=Albula goreensis TaxID=1534307 RepID=A0A8T3D6V0_9TELE|nr:hypothetical protein AGOR_G00122370 [Albula goreensis]